MIPGKVYSYIVTWYSCTSPLYPALVLPFNQNLIYLYLIYVPTYWVFGNTTSSRVYYNVCVCLCSPQESAKLCSSITNIGGAVLRSKTADIEHMLRKQAAAKPRKISQPSETAAALDKPKRKTSAEASSRHPLRMEPDPNVGERLAGGSSYRSPSPTRNVWRRRDVISSMPKHKKPYNWTVVLVLNINRISRELRWLPSYTVYVYVHIFYKALPTVCSATCRKTNHSWTSRYTGCSLVHQKFTTNRSAATS